MMNRYLTLVVAVAAPISATAMLVKGEHVAHAVSWSARAPGIALVLLAIALTVAHLRFASRTARPDAAMWASLSLFLGVTAFVSPQVGVWSVVAILSLAITSVARLAAGRTAGGLVASPFRRRIFA